MSRTQVWGAVCVSRCTFRLSVVFKLMRFYCLEINLYISKRCSLETPIYPFQHVSRWVQKTSFWSWIKFRIRSDQRWNKCSSDSCLYINKYWLKNGLCWTNGSISTKYRGNDSKTHARARTHTARQVLALCGATSVGKNWEWQQKIYLFFMTFLIF